MARMVEEYYFYSKQAMPIIQLATFIHAPVAIVYDLARSIELHLESTAHTREKAIAGRMTGLCEEGDLITWEATHFGIRQRLSVQIFRMQPPHYFEDRMVNGAFKSFRHQHFFEAQETGTLMKDIFDYKSPLGIFGKLADALFLKRYMTDLLVRRNAVIKQNAERAIK